MARPLDGIRVLEVAQYTFVPSGAAILADWGAEVIKIEHAEHGDAQRGLIQVLGLDVAGPGVNFFPIMEGPNRGKRSVGLTLGSPEATEILHQLLQDCDVFVTNFLPDARRKAGIDVDQIQAVNPGIIHVRGSGWGALGPERESGGYDSISFWARSGAAHALTASDADRLAGMPTGAYGDNLGGLTIAGGVAAALLKRERTGEASVVDVSLLAVGAWATQYGSNLAMVLGGELPPMGHQAPGAPRNPVAGNYQTKDGRWIQLNMLQPGKYWPEMCRVLGRSELSTDERFADAASVFNNGAQAAAILAEEFAKKTYEEWLEILRHMDGQWGGVQSVWELSQDASLRANGLVAKIVDSDGVARELIQSPVLFDNDPPTLIRAPQFAEHTDEVLSELGISEDTLLELKLAGIVT